MPKPRLAGTIRLRSSSSGACSETARWYWRFSSASRRMPLGIPTVEMVTRRAPIPSPSGAVAASRAGSKASRFNRGSPMPMATMCEIRCSAGSRRRKRSICSMISPLVRLRTHPSRPLAQNVQPMAQPTCELMQTV